MLASYLGEFGFTYFEIDDVNAIYTAESLKNKSIAYEAIILFSNTTF